jgi:hypothetical protein
MRTLVRYNDINFINIGNRGVVKDEWE